MTLDTEEFIPAGAGRARQAPRLRYVLPDGFMRIHHFGFLANRSKKQALNSGENSGDTILIFLSSTRFHACCIFPESYRLGIRITPRSGAFDLYLDIGTGLAIMYCRSARPAHGCGY